MGKKRKPLSKRIALTVKRIVSFLFSNQVMLIFLITFSILFVGAVVFYLLESGINQEINTPFDAIWWIVVTMSTVGYGDVFPETLGGRILAIFVMFTGVTFMGLFSATIASWIIERDIKGGMGMLNIDLSDHMVICGWNHQAGQLVENLLTDLEEEDRHLVILANLNQKPIEHKRVHFVKGDCTSETDLKRANMPQARTAMVLTDNTIGSAETADARSILTTLAIDTMNSSIYTCAEVLDSKNIYHLRNAGVDEVIPTGEFTGRLMARTVISHGISRTVSELLTQNEGSDLFKVGVPSSLVGKTFEEFLSHLRKKPEAIIPVAIDRKKQVHVNPDRDFRLEKGDNAIIICRKKLEPEDLE